LTIALVKGAGSMGWFTARELVKNVFPTTFSW
jgi:hypothetical protein